jgi:hypothetical protein
MKVFELLITAIGAIAFLVFISFLLSWPVYMLWNDSLLHAVNGVNEITWMQAWGINLLCGMLFKTTVNTKS